MHIEPGLVDGAKLALSYTTAAACIGYTAKLSADTIRKDGAAVLPHHPVGVSEVHLILGTTLMLLFGAAPAAIGLAGGLLIQGLFFAPFDLPQYGMNLTTLLVPLFATAALARRVIPDQMAYVDLRYGQALKLSLAYQGGIVLWVGFWALYGRGLGAENLVSIGSFGAAYMSVVLAEPLIDLAVLALAKTLRGLQGSAVVERRLHQPA
jgi:ABC-type Co2+ transport system permease subunit